MALISTALILSLYEQPLTKSKKYNVTEIMFVMVLILYLFGTPSFIYTNPRFLDVYGFSNLISQVIEDGGAYTHYLGPMNMYHGEFQGSTLLFCTISECTGVNILSISKYYTIYLTFMISFLIYIISIKILDLGV